MQFPEDATKQLRRCEAQADTLHGPGRKDGYTSQLNNIIKSTTRGHPLSLQHPFVRNGVCTCQDAASQSKMKTSLALLTSTVV